MSALKCPKCESENLTFQKHIPKYFNEYAASYKCNDCGGSSSMNREDILDRYEPPVRQEPPAPADNKIRKG